MMFFWHLVIVLTSVRFFRFKIGMSVLKQSITQSMRKNILKYTRYTRRTTIIVTDLTNFYFPRQTALFPIFLAKDVIHRTTPTLINQKVFFQNMPLLIINNLYVPSAVRTFCQGWVLTVPCDICDWTGWNKSFQQLDTNCIQTSHTLINLLLSLKRNRDGLNN